MGKSGKSTIMSGWKGCLLSGTTNGGKQKDIWAAYILQGALIVFSYGHDGMQHGTNGRNHCTTCAFVPYRLADHRSTHPLDIGNRVIMMSV